MHLHRRRLGDSEERVIVKIALHDAAAIYRDLLRHRLRQPVEHRALHLVLGAARVDDLATDVAGDPNLVDLHRAY